MNSKWEAKPHWFLSACAWWGISDGAFIGQAWKIIFSERSKSPFSRSREIKLETRNPAVSFLPFSFLTHKKERKKTKTYRWQVGYPHGNKTLLYFPTTACYLPECKEKVRKINGATNTIHFLFFCLSLLGPRVWWWRAQILKLNGSGLKSWWLTLPGPKSDPGLTWANDTTSLICGFPCIK